MSLAANRISYAFDLHGPSLAVDTACSSSLVAVDLACKAILGGDCDYALAGGVNVIIKPEMTIAMSKATMLSRDGRCKSFDSRADGYVRGEGAGLVVLRRLSHARAAGNPIYAMIRGSGVNSDGLTKGISVPNGDAQEALTRRVLKEAGVRSSTIAYVEAHGTGTPVGDPIEATALGRVFSEGRGASDAPLLLGSVKTNIGHLESASGVAGLIKAALCLEHGEIPPNLHFQTPNPAIDFDALKLRVVQQKQQWPEANTPRRAAVNSFGFGGTNAHVILEQAPAEPAGARVWSSFRRSDWCCRWAPATPAPCAPWPRDTHAISPLKAATCRTSSIRCPSVARTAPCRAASSRRTLAICASGSSLSATEQLPRGTRSAGAMKRLPPDARCSSSRAWVPSGGRWGANCWNTNPCSGRRSSALTQRSGLLPAGR